MICKNLRGNSPSNLSVGAVKRRPPIVILLFLSFSCYAEDPKFPIVDKNLLTPVLSAKVLNSMRTVWSKQRIGPEEVRPLCDRSENPEIFAAVPSALSTISSDGTLTFKLGDYLFFADFKLKSVLVRITNQKNDLDRSGVVIPFSEDLRWVFLNVKGPFDLAIFVPPLSDCARQFIVACPRVLKERNILEAIPLRASEPHSSFEGKAEAILIAPGSTTSGATRVSIRTTGNSPSLKEWQLSELGSKVSAKLEFQSEKADPEDILPAERVDVALPFTTAMESRADFLIPDKGLRSEDSKTIFYVEATKLDAPLKIFPKGITARVNPGECYIVSKHRVHEVE